MKVIIVVLVLITSLCLNESNKQSDYDNGFDDGMKAAWKKMGRPLMNLMTQKPTGSYRYPMKHTIASNGDGEGDDNDDFVIIKQKEFEMERRLRKEIGLKNRENLKLQAQAEINNEDDSENVDENIYEKWLCFECIKKEGSKEKCESVCNDIQDNNEDLFSLKH